MKEQLELKHVAPYLPYGLRSKMKCTNYRPIREVTVDNVMSYINCKIPAKIILRPLSDLTKEIEHNGERFVPIKIIGNWGESPLDFPYWITNKLISWHFDVFGLIEKGFAIDINILTKEV